MNTLVERLREGIADTGVLIKSAANVNATMYEAADLIEEQQASIKELEKDAARYQYLRSRDPRKDVCDQCGYDGLHLRAGHLLDCHIDAALEQKEIDCDES